MARAMARVWLGLGLMAMARARAMARVWVGLGLGLWHG